LQLGKLPTGESMNEEPQTPSLLLSLAPLGVLVCILILNVAVFGDGATGGPNQIALLVAAMVSAVIGRFVLKVPYKTIERGALHSIGLSMQANLILLTVGGLIGLWILAGIVPTLIYYGITLISPSVFLLVACLSCSLVSISIGSSWSTMGTLGVALVATGQTLGIPLSMVAGAVISGSYFGDKLSPLSDTTNLAPAVSGTDLFTHVKHLLYTTLPAYVISLAAFAVVGFFYQGEGSQAAVVADALTTIQGNFNIGLHTLIAPALVVVLIIKKVPALPSLFIGMLLGALEALLFQRHFLLPEGAASLVSAYETLINTAASGYSSETGNSMIDDLFSKGGMASMLNTIFLILMAMTFGGVMEATGMLQAMVKAILRMVHGAGSLVAATIGSCILFNVSASEQYLAIVVPGRMFRGSYAARGLAPQNLSRALEDGGTVTSVLVPWNTCGAFAASVLGVGTFAYLPWCFFNLLCPVIGVALASAGWTLVREKEVSEDSASD
jgi:Na+:H+ antiporter, NhaC family